MSSWSAPGGDSGRERPTESWPQDAPPAAPPYGSPYGVPPAPGPPSGHAPYGQAPYGQPPYGQAPYGQAPHAQPPHGQPAPYGPSSYGANPYGPQPYGAPFAYGAPAPYGGRPPMSSRWRAATITQIVLSVLLTAFGCGLGLPSLVLSIVAMTRAQQDAASATKLSKIGWVCFAVALVLLVVLWTVLLGSGTTSGLPSRIEDV